MVKEVKQNDCRKPEAPFKFVRPFPALTPEEQAEFIDSFDAGEARVEAEEFVEYDPADFEDRLVDIHRNSRG